MLNFFLQIVLHWLIGLVLTAYVWACGALAAKKLGFWREHRDSAGGGQLDLAVAYPFGLLWAFIAATIVTIPSVPGILGAALVLMPAALLWTERAHVRGALRKLAMPVAAGSIPGVVAAGVWHGATAELPGRYMFDSAHYAGRIQTVLVSGPFGKELSVEGVSFYGRMMEQGPAHIGAVFGHLPGVDPFLFFSAAAVTFFGASTGICLSLLGIGRNVRMSDRLLTGLLLGVLMAVMTKYPSWLVESPPIAFALPLGFSALCILDRDDLSIGKLVLYGTVLLGALYLSKVLAAVFFAVLLIPHFVRTVARQTGRAAAAAATLTVTGAAAAALALNSDIIAMIGKPFVRSGWTYADMLGHMDLLLVLLVVSAIVILPSRYGISAAVAGSTYWILPSFINLSVGLLLQIVAAHGSRFRRARPLLFVLAVVGAASSFAAVRGRNADILLFASLSLGFALACSLSTFAGIRLKWMLTLGGIVTAFAVSLAVAEPSGSVFTPAKYTFWREVSRRLPPDALVFTDQTGADIISLAEGANYLSSLGERQLYIGGWAYLANDSSARRRRLETNRAVLEGRLRPDAISLTKPYSDYFAVLDAKSRAPANFQAVFSNVELALYRIPNPQPSSLGRD